MIYNYTMEVMNLIREQFKNEILVLLNVNPKFSHADFDISSEDSVSNTTKLRIKYKYENFF